MESMRLSSSFLRSGRRLTIVVPLAIAAFLVTVMPGMASASGLSNKLLSAASVRKADVPNRGTLGTAAKRSIEQGYLVPNQAGYDRQKARVTRRAQAQEALTAPMSAPASGPLAPSTVRAWQGINDTFSTPPDETSAVGTTRYIELVNRRFAIYNKTSSVPISQGTLNSLVGAASADNVFDPQIIWDPTTNRFYYAADQVVSPTNNKVAFGFSKVASPSSAADWCKYAIGSGTLLADYPKLGDSQHFAIIGTNLFNGNTFAGSNIVALSKPKAGDTCTTYGNTVKVDNKGISGGFTPVPANEIDTNAIGWAVARAPSPLPNSTLRLFKITRNATTGNPVIGTTGTQVPVGSYNVPPNAPQQGSVNKIDTLDGRNTQAVAAVDPAHSSKFALWTQHTVQGGAGAEVRWYEIQPSTHSVIQKGKATSGALYDFNGAISPNRQVIGATKAGGGSMVMNFNTSSSAVKPGIRMVSKLGGNAQSGQVAVKTSPGQLSGFDCFKDPQSCRWGDYAAATPDPSANRIWNVSQFAVGSGSGTSGPATSRTWNFIAAP
jgi:hypothetical protein